MSQILNNLYLGSLEDILISWWDIIISVLTTREFEEVEGFIQCESYVINVRDGQQGVEQIVSNYSTFKEILKRNPEKKILIHCNRGISRSATFIIIYLIQCLSYTQIEAILHVKNCRPIVNPNPYFIELLDDLCQHLL